LPVLSRIYNEGRPIEFIRVDTIPEISQQQPNSPREQEIVLLGRVTDRPAGEMIREKTKQILSAQYSYLGEVNLKLPDEIEGDERMRKFAQAVACVWLVNSRMQQGEQSPSLGPNQGASTTKIAPNTSEPSYAERRDIEFIIGSNTQAGNYEDVTLTEAERELIQARAPPQLRELLAAIDSGRLVLRAIDLGDQVLFPRHNPQVNLGVLAYAILAEGENRIYVYNIFPFNNK